MRRPTPPRTTRCRASWTCTTTRRWACLTKSATESNLANFCSSPPIALWKWKSTATREGEPAQPAQIVEGYYTTKVVVMTSSDACGFLRRGRKAAQGGNWGKGYGRGNFVLRQKDISSNQIQKFPRFRCSHPICQYLMVEASQVPPVRKSRNWSLTPTLRPKLSAGRRWPELVGFPSPWTRWCFIIRGRPRFRSPPRLVHLAPGATTD